MGRGTIGRLGVKHWELIKLEGSYICFILFVVSLSEIKAFEDAAKQYQPLLPFFAVFDKKVPCIIKFCMDYI